MKISLLLAAAAGLVLVSATAPSPTHEGEGARSYPPCSSTLRDNCVQRGPADPARSESAAMGMPGEGRMVGNGAEPHAAPAPMRTARRNYPPCTATRADSCMQGTARYAARARPVRYAMRVRRAGERG